MRTSEMLDYLNRDGNLRVPCSRYGSDTESVAVVAASAAVAYAEATGEAVTRELLDYVMGLAVNDHDDIEYLIDSYSGLGGSVEA